MSIGLTTVVLFAVFGILLFLSCPISVSIVIASIVFFCHCRILSFMGSDHLYHHAEDEQRCRKLLPSCHSSVYPGWKHHE